MSDDNRLAGPDALRGIAALGVAIAHYVYLETHSPYAEAASAAFVELFFPLSGFVLASQMLRCVEAPRNLGVFYARRWIRTLPPYLIALTAAAALFHPSAIDWLIHALFLQEVVPVQSDFFSIAWSLAVEEWYYLLMPLLLIGGARLGLSPLKTTLALIALLIAAKVAVVFAGHGADLRTSTFLRLDAIALGFAAFILLHKPERSALAPFSIALLLLAPLWLAAQGVVGGSDLARLAFVLLAMAAGALFVIAAARIKLGNSAPAQAFAQVALWLGRVSYPVYLFHLIAYVGLYRAGVGLVGLPGLAAYVATTLAGAALFHICIEKPLLAARPSYRR